MSTAPVVAKRPPGRGALAAWLLVAVLDGISQIVLRRELAPGEFGTVNTVLGLVAVLAAPLLALEFVLARETAPHRHEARGAALALAVPVWSVAALVLLLVSMPHLALPRPSVELFALFATGAALLSIFSRTICATENRMRFWTALILVAAAARLLASLGLPLLAPYAQSGLVAVVLAGIITAIPAMIGRAGGPTRGEAWALLREGEFVRPFLATASVLVGLALFTNADRIVAQRNFGVPRAEYLDYVDWTRFDDYQAAGMMARALLWGALPLLLVLHADRAALARTSRRSLRFFWIYLFALFAGDVVFASCAPFLSRVFTGNAAGAAQFIPGFAGAAPLLGLLQGFGIFLLASRRYPECFTLGACSIAYALGLFFFGRQPQVMTTCMSGGALLALTIVLIFGVVRYARSHA